MTTPLLITAVPYSSSPLALFARLRQRPGAILLDSGRPVATSGRYDIMSSDPLALMEVTQQGQLHCTPPLPAETVAELDAFQAQQKLLEQLPPITLDSDLPFLGGLLGYWSYDLGRRIHAISATGKAVTQLPACRLGLYDWAIIQDHHCQQAWLVATAERGRQVRTWLAQPAPASAEFTLLRTFTAELDRQAYGQRFEAVQRYIRAGDCYQINLAQRFHAPYTGDLWQAYLRLRNATPTPFSGYMAWADKAVLSLSPERFLQCRHPWVETHPIKGTRPRGKTPQEDRALASQLSNSEKDRAENVMIVDLLRNDLGRVCRPGSIRVPQLCKLQSYPNVHHLVSVVQGQLSDERTPLALLAAAFPGGSITGAPKVRAMQIIDELEPSQRSVYCGSLGYVDRRGHMDTSIAIRSVIADAGELHVWGGGGLVADSVETEEYTETLDKIRHLIGALE
ncbi:aminodeoxychorismate synthase component I [Vreelandella rituensis]|uniref:aminodeoxychorismate synthase n=1 Tax=Vreelandella rituensis TaxID=2282306 RepID=A0A368TS62_9GAMM|nr:aminodeoxychorismate synthase component I [Halomonas rituensis]RCV87555.1 aminodeoxychorismate synthase component I [Halomonas rituensis]